MTLAKWLWRIFRESPGPGVRTTLGLAAADDLMRTGDRLPCAEVTGTLSV